MSLLLETTQLCALGRKHKNFYFKFLKHKYAITDNGWRFSLGKPKLQHQDIHKYMESGEKVIKLQERLMLCSQDFRGEKRKERWVDKRSEKNKY